MNKKLTLKADQVSKMLLTLDQSISAHLQGTPGKPTPIADLPLPLKASIIKRFGLCYNEFWDYLKSDLEIHHGTGCSTSPRAIAQAALLRNVISEEEFTTAETVIALHKRIADSHEAEVANEIINNTPQALALMKTILERLKKNIHA